jgi:hypothetical protein
VAPEGKRTTRKSVPTDIGADDRSTALPSRHRYGKPQCAELRARARAGSQPSCRHASASAVCPSAAIACMLNGSA